MVLRSDSFFCILSVYNHTAQCLQAAPETSSYLSFSAGDLLFDLPDDADFDLCFDFGWDWFSRPRPRPRPRPRFGFRSGYDLGLGAGSIFGLPEPRFATVQDLPTVAACSAAATSRLSAAEDLSRA